MTAYGVGMRLEPGIDVHLFSFSQVRNNWSPEAWLKEVITIRKQIYMAFR